MGVADYRNLGILHEWIADFFTFVEMSGTEKGKNEQLAFLEFFFVLS